MVVFLIWCVSSRLSGWFDVVFCLIIMMWVFDSVMS